MRVKTPKIVMTFASASDAMAMEAVAREHGIPGRIIPVPSEIAAGCGLSWCADEAEGEALLGAVADYGIAHEGAFRISLY